jgi:predicted PurR-regulated permease PerM
MLEDLHASPWLRRTIVLVLLAGLVLLTYGVLKPFLVPVIWALILTYVTWPLFVRLRALLRNQVTLASIVMTLLLATAFVVPLVWLASLLRSELANAYDVLANFLARRPQLPDSIVNIPWFGEWLQALIDRVSRDPASLPAELGTLADQSLGEIRTVIGGVGRNLA